MKINKQLIYFHRRCFAPPKPAASPAGKGGPPGASAPVAPVKPIPTPFEKMIEKGQEFPLGPPPGVNIVKGAHRNVIIPKIEGRMDIFAKKLRDYYIREGVIPDEKIYIDAVRLRQPEDTIEKLREDRLVPAVIDARDEFQDVDLVYPMRTAHSIRKQAHYTVRPFYVRHNDEEIRVTVKNIDLHVQSQFPYFMAFQRYIVGRPNLLCLPIYPVQEDKSLHWQAGANFMFLTRELYVWSFVDKYPPSIEVNCEDISPSYAIKIGDIEKMLPYGMYLHKMYDHQKSRSVVKLRETGVYIQRKNQLSEVNEQIREQKEKMQLSLISEKKKEKSVKDKGTRNVPKVVVSAKILMQEKKERDKAAGKEEEKGGKKK